MPTAGPGGAWNAICAAIDRLHATMSRDRRAALRAADKLLRLGKLRLAIEAYTHLVDEDPRDWDTALVLAGLHVRARDLDAAAACYAALAHALCDEGDFIRAADICVKVLALRPGDEDALRQLAAIALRQGRTDEARRHLLDLGERLATRGETGAAAEALGEAAALDPADTALRDRIFSLALEAGHLECAREHARRPDQQRALASALQQSGRTDDAIALLTLAAAEDPDHLPTVALLAKLLVQAGDAVAASSHLTPGMAGADPEARLGLIEIWLRGGRADAALELAERTIADAPDFAEALARLAGRAAAHVPDVALRLVDLSVEHWTSLQQWEPAAAALQRFVACAPGCIDALVRLVEVAVDGDLAATASHAQEMLADAYLASGALEEGSAIAEDLAAREPDNPVHQARLRQAQELAATLKRKPAEGLRHAPTVIPFRSSAAG